MTLRRTLLLLISALLLPIAAVAQDLNRLWIPDVTATPGETVTLPVYVRNTCNDLVGAQFELTLPAGVTLDANGGTATDRCTDHEVLVRRNGNAWRVMLYSPSNAPLRGNAGIVLHLQAELGSSFQAEQHYPMSINRVILSDSHGNNVATAHDCGDLVIGPSADFIVTSVTADQQTLTPGGSFTATWVVANQGRARSHGGWKEELFLVNSAGEVTLLDTRYPADSLAVGASTTHSAVLTVPQLPGIEGSVKLQVKLTPNIDSGEAVEYQGNNTGTGTQALNLAKRLFIEAPARLDEGSGTQRCRLARSGSWAQAQTFTLALAGDGRLTPPATVTIPAGQSAVWFNLTRTDDSTLNTDSLFTLTAKGNGYTTLTWRMVVVDDEQPTLTVTASKSVMTEGETIRLTIATSRASAQPLLVNLGCDATGRFEYPAQVSIPAQATSVAIDVKATDNTVIETTASATFTATASRHHQGECIVLLNDNDLPTLSLTLTPTQVSEAAGANAVIGTIRRTDRLDTEVVIRLSDDGQGRVSCPRSVTMAAGQAEVQFSIDTNDNSVVDGNQAVTITAAVYAASCSCSLPSESGGTMTQTLQVVDDDGPSLAITSSAKTLLEGSTGNVFTVSHNVAASKAITVTISSDKDDQLTYNHELTIPARAKSAQLLVDVKRNSTTGDSNLATFTVQANGYAPATLWMVITDQTLPDATIGLALDQTEVEAEGTLGVTLTVTNTGYQTLPAATPVRLYFSGVNYPVELQTDRALAPGASTTLAYDYTLPAITGAYTLHAKVNERQEVQELVYANNTSEKLAVTLLPKYRVTAQADKDVYVHGEPITISGQALGSAGANASVEVYLINEGSRQKTLLKSGADGRFSVVWPLQERQAGHFVIGACYPGTNETVEMDAFDVYGIRTDSYYATCMVDQGDTYTGKLNVTNPGLLAQHGLRIEPQATADNATITFASASSIAGGATIALDFTIQGNAVTSGTDWQQLPVVITTDEGATARFTLYYYVQALHAQLSSSTKRFSTTMTYGKPREYPITVRNIGKGETGAISLSLPNWMSTSSSYNIAPLAKGDSTTIVLQFVPTSEMKLNVPVTGQLGINCANGQGLAIPFDITPVSEESGTLTLDVMDESAFFTEEKPHLAGARVTVKTPVAGKVVAQGLTKADGTFTASLPEGWYTIHVEADKHSSYDNTLIVDPGATTTHEVFLTYEAITYTWEVEETEVEDVYEMETVVTYDTRVPKPVVVVYLPNETPELYGVLPIVVTNEGQIDAVDLSLSLSVDEGYYFEFLNTPTLDVLKAHQSYTFYAKLMPREDAEDQPQNARRKALAISKKCWTIIAKSKYHELCEKFVGEQMAQAVKRYGDHLCVTKVEITGDKSGGGGINDNNTGGFGWRGDGNSGGWPDPPYIGGSKKNDSTYTIFDTENASQHCEPLYPDLETLTDGPVPQSGDCYATPVLNYSLVTYDKTREKVSGVAADGATLVCITLDPLTSIIPDGDCPTKIKWQLSKDLGQLKSDDSWVDIVYKAPDRFPDDVSTPTDTIFAQYAIDGPSGHLEGAVPIVITRPPLLLLHGLIGTSDCWKSFADRIVKANLYDERGIDNIGYEASNCDHFEANEHVVQDRLDFLFTKMKHEMGIVATKADIVGHSMGGILARVHAEHVTTDNIHKIITVNTPHSGSEIADLAINEEILQKTLDVATLFEPMGLYSLDAVEDLSVNSDAIDKYLNGPENLAKAVGVPVHAIATEWRHNTGEEEQERQWDSIEDYIEANGYPEDDFMAKATLFLKLLKVSATDLFNEKAAGDIVVSLESQRGGLADECVDYIVGPSHTASPDDQEVQDKLLAALLAPVDDPCFSTDGFHPAERLFIVPDNLFDIDAKDMHLKVEEVDGETQLTIEGVDGTIFKIAAFFSNGDFNVSNSGLLKFKVPPTHEGDIKVLAIVANTLTSIGKQEGKRRAPAEDRYAASIKEFTVNVPQAKAHPVRLVPMPMGLLVGQTLRPTVKCIYDDGTEEHVTPDAIRAEKGYVRVDGKNLIATKAGKESLRLTYKNVGCNATAQVYKASDDDASADESESICSTITLSFKQQMVMTRQAFRGTLTVNNGSGQGAMEDMTLHLVVRDTEGKTATAHEFQINPEALTGFTGALDFESGWRLAANATGTATILFIPTRYAAPTAPVDYSFGGTFSYKDPTTGLQVTRELNAVTLTVNPSPTLDLDYFLQRDVFADDPLTEEVEVSQPAEFALLINNKGYGDATKVRLTTNQPEIVDNEKGLLIDFEILSSQVNGGDAHLSFGKNAVNDFGTIAAQSQSYAQWWLRSSLLGHFTSYDITATHLTSYGNEDLSLLDQVSIHELVHGFTVDDGRGFLVNDIPDNANQPDQVYLTDATHDAVHVATSMSITRQSAVEYVLTVNTSQPGWTYGQLPDPTSGMQDILSIVRQRDGKVLPLDNVWLTDKTLRKGKDPLYENLLHFVGEALNGTETYLLTFEERPDTVLEVSSFDGLPAEGSLSSVAVSEVRVAFNKAIRPATFTAADLTLTCQGRHLDASKATISQVSEKVYDIHLADLTTLDGYYVLTVMTNEITDSEGFEGEKGFAAKWTQLNNGKATLAYTITPEGTGTIAIATRTAEGAAIGMPATLEENGTLPVAIGSIARLTARPAEGYAFDHWSRGGETVSSDSIYEVVMAWNEEVTAHFRPNRYQVTIDNYLPQGKVTGAATGIYDYGTVLHLDVEPYGTNRFIKWVINDTEEVTTAKMDITVRGDLKLTTVYALLGDVNYDRILSITDVMLMVGHVIGNSTLENTNNADMNSDGIITVGDVMSLIKALLY